MIIPSIDLMKGKAVQLRGGREKILERKDVFKLAEYFSRFGEIAVVDLDAALNQGNNSSIIQKLCRMAKCRVGGGIRTISKANQILNYGASQIIIGSKAIPDFLSNLPKSKIIVALDAYKGNVVTHGWRKTTSFSPEQMAKELAPYCSGFLYTIVEKEGRLKGTDLESFKRLQKVTDLPITAAGGISSIREIKALDRLGINSQLGMALYTGKLKLDEIFISLLDFNKGNGFIPTIVQDINGQVLMLAYSNRQSIAKTLSTGQTHFFSRQRRKLWHKGEESGNNQDLITVRYDCDRDAILYVVAQRGTGACHTGSYSCFGEQSFTLGYLWDVLDKRLRYPIKGSYTSLIGKSRSKINAKIMEEAREVCKAKSKNALIWEVADVMYFLTVLMAKNQITYSDIYRELKRRHKG
jgi:phosphoribosylformimino-5-aminoimidazole carboxamide ribotide isomerase